MGYACPVCETPQVDGRHLANHVAFTALTGDAAHEDWLDEHVPDWGQRGEDELAEAVVPHAAESDVADAFADEGGAPAVDPSTGQTPAPNLDGDAADVLAEAQEYTRRMAEAGRDDPDEPAEDTTGDDAATGDETE